jgi:isopentenyl diphosphate isomerase/L-lactate dehydrogenase-like FMN-dependent dehydrogenase
MGANFVMLGRPFMFALGAEGARGVNALMRILGEDTSLTLAQTGLTDINQVTPSMLDKCPPELFMETLESSKNAT